MLLEAFLVPKRKLTNRFRDVVAEVGKEFGDTTAVYLFIAEVISSPEIANRVVKSFNRGRALGDDDLGVDLAADCLRRELRTLLLDKFGPPQ